MLRVSIPGREDYDFRYIVLDYNGTLATDGACDARVKNLLKSLASNLRVFVLTADTYGSQ